MTALDGAVCFSRPLNKNKFNQFRNCCRAVKLVSSGNWRWAGLVLVWLLKLKKKKLFALKKGPQQDEGGVDVSGGGVLLITHPQWDRAGLWWMCMFTCTPDELISDVWAHLWWWGLVCVGSVCIESAPWFRGMKELTEVMGDLKTTAALTGADSCCCWLHNDAADRPNELTLVRPRVCSCPPVVIEQPSLAVKCWN